MHTYGSHLFHTSQPAGRRLRANFTRFNDYQHRVYSRYQGRIYPMPINLGTITTYFERAMSPDEARALVAEQAAELGGCDAGQPRGEGDQPDRPPPVRGVHPRLHRQAVADRPAGARRGHHHSAAGALHLRQPLLQRHVRGPAARWLHRMADSAWPSNPLITVALETDFFDLRDEIREDQLVVYTGPLDRYFDFGPASSLGAPSTSRPRSWQPGTTRAPR